MTGDYPDHITYRELYLRYFQGRDAGELLQLLEPLQGLRLLDLCCGEGQLTLGALERGAASAVSVDAESAMIAPRLRQNRRAGILIASVQDALRALQADGKKFDRAVCRQAVNYWLNEETVQLLAAVLIRGGVFVFNTFNQRPTEKPRVLEYELQGHCFVEVSWLVGEIVHHLQVRDGLPAHFTSFQWLSPERLQELLTPYFTVSEQRHGKTSLYQCERR